MSDLRRAHVGEIVHYVEMAGVGGTFCRAALVTEIDRYDGHSDGTLVYLRVFRRNSVECYEQVALWPDARPGTWHHMDTCPHEKHARSEDAPR